jgi:hypothetical protein
VTSPIPPTHKKMYSYQVEEDDREFVVVIPGNGNGTDKYNGRDDEVEDGGDNCKPAAPPPLGSGICIGRNDNNDNSSDNFDCKEITTTTPAAMASKDSWDATTGGSHAPSASRQCLTSRL